MSANPLGFNYSLFYNSFVNALIDNDKPLQRTIKRSRHRDKPLNTSGEEARRRRQMERGVIKIARS